MYSSGVLISIFIIGSNNWYVDVLKRAQSFYWFKSLIDRFNHLLSAVRVKAQDPSTANVDGTCHDMSVQLMGVCAGIFP